MRSLAFPIMITSALTCFIIKSKRVAAWSNYRTFTIATVFIQFLAGRALLWRTGAVAGVSINNFVGRASDVFWTYTVTL